MMQTRTVQYDTVQLEISDSDIAQNGTCPLLSSHVTHRSAATYSNAIGVRRNRYPSLSTCHTHSVVCWCNTKNYSIEPYSLVFSVQHEIAFNSSCCCCCATSPSFLPHLRIILVSQLKGIRQRGIDMASEFERILLPKNAADKRIRTLHSSFQSTVCSHLPFLNQSLLCFALLRFAIRSTASRRLLYNLLMPLLKSSMTQCYYTFTLLCSTVQYKQSWASVSSVDKVDSRYSTSASHSYLSTILVSLSVFEK